MNNVEFLNVNPKYHLSLNDSYEQATQKLKDAKIDCLPVLDNEGNYSGLLHRYDLVERWNNLKKNLDEIDLPVSDFVNKNAQVDFVEINEGHWLQRLINRSSKYSHSMVPILNKDGSFKCFAYTPSDKESLRIVSAFKPSITIIGMGYVGVTLAVMMANCGFLVTCVEKNQKKRKLLSTGKVPFLERGVNELYEKLFKEKKFIIKSPSEDNESNFIVITVGTPLKTNSRKPNTNYLDESLKLARKQLKKGGVIVLRSTIPFGTTMKIKEKYFDEFISIDAENTKHIVFCPERTIEGKALEELKINPQIIGSESLIARGKVKKVFEQFVSQTIELFGVSEAELVKLCDNTYRDLSFAFSNMLASISMNYDVDIISVIEAANKDYPRTNISLPSPGVGGPCLSKDPYILSNSVSRLDRNITNYLHSGRNLSEITMDYIVKKVKNLNFGKNKQIVVCGMAFKGDPITDDLRDSTSIKLFSKLKQKIGEIRIWDPVISSKEFKNYDIKAKWSPPPWKEKPKKDLIIILANNSPYFTQLDWASIIQNSRKLTIIDCWGVCENLIQLNKKSVDYYRLGRNL